MRTLALLLLIGLMHTSVSAQKVMRLSDARTIGLTMEHMDSLYRSAFNVQDSTDCAFPGKSEQFLELWPGTLQSLGDHLHEQGFRTDRDLPITYRIFFGTDGKIEHFHYGIRDTIAPNMESTFQKGSESFSDAYIFPLKANMPFKQCGKMVLKADPE